MKSSSTIWLAVLSIICDYVTTGSAQAPPIYGSYSTIGGGDILAAPAYLPSYDNVCFNFTDGQLYNTAWFYALPSSLITASSYSYVNFTSDGEPVPVPVIGNDGTVYVASQNGTLYAFDPSDLSTPKWTNNVIGQDGFGIAASPAIGFDGNIYIATDETELSGNQYIGGLFYCIDPDLGLPKWKLRLADPNGTTPDVDASPVVTPSGIFAVDEGANTGGGGPNYPTYLHFITFYGQEYTPLKVANNSHSEPDPSPAVGPNGWLYICTADGTLVVVDPVQRTELFAPLTLNTTSPPPPPPFRSSPVIGPPPDGGSSPVLYVVDNDGYLFAVSIPANNQPSLLTQTSDDVSFSAAATVASDSTVYISDSSGETISDLSLQSTGGGAYTFQTIQSWGVPIIIEAPPLLASVGAGPNNVLYVAGTKQSNRQGSIYGFSVSAGPSTSTWSTFQGNDQRQGRWGSGSITPPELWSVQFGMAPLISQTGKAAYGNSSGDYWNAAVVPYDSNPNPSWGYTLADASDNVNHPWIRVTPNSGQNFRGDNVIPSLKPFNDNLMKNIITAQSASFAFVISQLPTSGFKTGAPALYDVYVYAYGGQGTYNGTTYSYNSQIKISPAGTDPVTGNQVSTLTTSSTPPPDLSHFIEGFEYVVFRNVPVDRYHPNVMITVTNDTTNPISFPMINGIQVVAKQ